MAKLNTHTPSDRRLGDRARLTMVTIVIGVLLATIIGAGMLWIGTGSRFIHQPARDVHFAATRGKGVASYQPYCGNPRNRDDSDLCAQWSAVQAVVEANALARIGVWLNAAGVFAALAGAVLVLRSLSHSRHALAEARKANGIAADASEAQLRAWVDVSFDLKGFVHVNEDPHLRGTVTLTNVGATPAKNVTYYLGMAFGEAPERHVENIITDFITDELNWSDVLLFPNQPHVRETSSEHSGTALKTDQQMHIFVVAAYTTVFSDQRRITSRMWEVLDSRREDRFVNPQALPHLQATLLTYAKSYAGEAT